VAAHQDGVAAMIAALRLLMPSPWMIVAGLAAIAGAFLGGMHVQKKFYQAAQVAVLEKKISDLQADATANEALIKEFNDDARKHDQTFREIEDRSTGDDCTVLDGDSLRMFNDGLGWEVPAPAGKPHAGSRKAPAPH
jgi:hypothetical protein